MKPSRLPWIQKGYQVFAFEGPIGLKVERLAKGVGKNKSSFYHHFADLDLFIKDLLDYHLEQAHQIAVKEANAKNQKELIDIMLDHKLDLLFNRQLRIHRENKEFEAVFIQVNHLTGQAILRVWSEILGLGDNSYLAELVLRLSLENFFLQITHETLNREWLNHYFKEIQMMIRALRESGSAKHSLDGTV